MKQKNNIPSFLKKLPGSFWGISSFFNIASYKNKYENYLRFRESSKRQGLKLLTVEMAFGDKPFELKEGDAEILIQLRGNEKNVLWQKEAMLNIGLKNLPKDCDKFAWLDCDVIFKNDSWIRETSKLLEKYKIVQPFEWAVGMNMGEEDVVNFEKRPFGLYDGKRIYGKAYQMANLESLKGYELEGHSGFAWAARKEVFDKIGFYDKMVLGSSEGDLLMARAFFSDMRPGQFHLQYPLEARKDQDKWAEKMYRLVGGNVFYCKGNVLHLWHGRFKNRFYYGGNELLRSFDIDKDLRHDSRGVLEWSSDKKRLHSAVRKYFFKRNEAGSFLMEILLLLDKIYYALFVMNFRVFYSRNMNKFLGFFGSRLKKLSPKTYYRLKRFFPDR